MMNAVDNRRNVAAVVVTFNRLEKLKKVLASLESQTFLPKALIIVDNASTDGTADYLHEYQDAFSLKGKVELRIVTLPKNVGGAGGFSAGMREGYQMGLDYVWIFDDDGYPEPDALEKLLGGYEQATKALSPDIPFACSLIKYIDGTISEMNNPGHGAQGSGADQSGVLRVRAHPALGHGSLRSALQGVLHLV